MPRGLSLLKVASQRPSRPFHRTDSSPTAPLQNSGVASSSDLLQVVIRRLPEKKRRSRSPRSNGSNGVTARYTSLER
jgi:hypothetical protein